MSKFFHAFPASVNDQIWPFTKSFWYLAVYYDVKRKCTCLYFYVMIVEKSTNNKMNVNDKAHVLLLIDALIII